MGYPIFHSQFTAAQIEASIGKTPRIKSSTRTWEVWDIATSAYVDTGVSIDTEIFVDDTLSQAGYAADAAKTGELKSTLASEVWNIYNGYYKVAQTLEWVQGGILASNGSSTDNPKRIRTGILRGTCDVVAIYAPNKKIAVFSYIHNRSTNDYTGALSLLTQTDENGMLYVPMTKGMAIVVMAGYLDDADIIPDDGAGIEIYKCYQPRKTTKTLSSNIGNEEKIIGRFYAWELGIISGTAGGNANNTLCIRTQDYIPVTPGRRLTFTGASTETTTAYVYFYTDVNSSAYMFRLPLINENVVAPQIVPQGAKYARFTYGNTTASGIQVTNGMDYVDAYSLSVENNTFAEYLKHIGFVDFTVTKGYWKNGGGIATNTNGICSSDLLELPVGQTVRVIISDPHWRYSIKGGNTTNALNFTARNVTYNEFEITHKYTGIMLYKTDDAGVDIDLTPADFDGSVLFFVNPFTTNKEVFIHDVPENIGVLNVINRAYQMAKLTYTPVANLPTQVNTQNYPGYVPEGQPISGVMYSSVRNEGLYVPQCVSIDSYMTALKNPNSYIYTKTEPVLNDNWSKYNAKTYNGAVCSSMVAWCYGIDDVVPTTISFDTYPGMELIENQSVYGLKLGDMLNKSGSHIEIVTDIVRNNRGIIQYVELTDQVNNSSHPWTRKRNVIPSYIDNTMIGSDGYVAMRYHYIYKVPYVASPWINLDDETAEPTWNTHLSPRRGDKANWRPGEKIQIDVTDGEGYVSAKLYNGDTLERTDSIPSSNLIEYENLLPGKYKVCLTNGADNSDFVYFDIIGTSETFTPQGSKQVAVTFSSSMTGVTPASISFCVADSNDKDYRGVRAFRVLSTEEISAEETIVEAPTTGTWLMKVMYKTDFGLYSSDLTQVTVS